MYSESTRDIARDILQSNTAERGYSAGATHFNDLWARDALYACWGAIQHDMPGVEQTLESLQRAMKHGQVPLRIGRQNMVNVFLGLPTKEGPVYTNDKSDDPALDPNLLYTITASKQILHDKTTFSTYKDSIHQALRWLRQHRDDKGLLEEQPYASWDDALKKQGVTAYTNILYVAALRHAADAVSDKAYEEQANRVEDALIDHLWEQPYFKAWEDRDVCDVAANLLAIIFDIGTSSMQSSILTHLYSKQEDYNDMFLKTNYPSYPWYDTYLPFYLVGMQDYHNRGPYWTWITALEGLARQKLKKDNAENIHRLDTWIKENQDIPEVLNEKQEPLNRLCYKSEQQFTWTAGLILTSYH